MGSLVQLSPAPEPGLHPDTLRGFVQEHGPIRSQGLLTDTTFRLIELLSAYETIGTQGGHRASVLAEEIATLSPPVGALDLAAAAVSARECALRDDQASRAATAHRLVRAGEAALEHLLAATMAPD